MLVMKGNVFKSLKFPVYLAVTKVTDKKVHFIRFVENDDGDIDSMTQESLDKTAFENLELNLINKRLGLINE